MSATTRNASFDRAMAGNAPPNGLGAQLPGPPQAWSRVPMLNARFYQRSIGPRRGPVSCSALLGSRIQMLRNTNQNTATRSIVEKAMMATWNLRCLRSRLASERTRDPGGPSAEE